VHNYDQTLQLVLLKLEKELNSGEFSSVTDIKYENLVPSNYPSILFALESALFDLKNGGRRIIFDNEFSRGNTGITINGLVWMDSNEEMLKQAVVKVKSGFSCIKFKIGALDFKDEYSLLKKIRNEFPEISIRLDANGAFKNDEALEKLKKLSELDIHSIEQPIKAGQWQEMAYLCEKSPVPVALDEELIGISDKEGLLETIYPHFIVLKPSLIGGIAESEKWIKILDNFQTGFWITSALESNIGLNAIAQWAFPYTLLKSQTEQGLGTGNLYMNNIQSPLEIREGRLIHNSLKSWKLSFIT
jgi:o-succinylbenzoate synthase